MPGIFRGSTAISSLKLGSANVSEVYYGSTRIWPLVTSLSEGTPGLGAVRTGTSTPSWSMSLGTESPSRRIVVTAQVRHTLSSLMSPTLTINGTPATLAIKEGRAVSLIGIWYMDLPAGTSATIAMNLGVSVDTAGWSRIVVHPLYGVTESGPIGTAFDASLDNKILSIPSFNVGIATAMGLVSDPSVVTWSNATGRFTYEQGPLTVSYGAGRLRADSSIDVRFGSISGGPSALLVGAVWR